MEQDQQLKEILLNSAERPSINFTGKVMQTINAAEAAQQQSLVNPTMKRAFIFVFGSIAAAIAGLCLLIAANNLPFISWMQNIVIPDLDYKTILVFILSFWFVFISSSLIEKRKLHFK